MAIDACAARARLAEYCAAFDLEPPPMVLGDDATLDDNGPLWAFCHREGISIDWLLLGKVAPPASRPPMIHPVELRYLRAVGRLSRDDQARLLAALKDYQRNGGDMQEAFRRHGLAD
jgi:hypothetical protein